MFDETMFFHPFWEWLIIGSTLGGIFLMFALIIWMGKPPKPSVSDFIDPDIMHPDHVDHPVAKKVETMGHVWDEDLEEYNNPLPKWWLNMFYITLIFGLIYLILYPGLGSFAGVLNTNQIKEYELEVEAAETRYAEIYNKFSAQPIEQLVENSEAVRIGQRLFVNHCATCHGSDAGGGPGFPNLRDQDWIWGGEPAQIKQTILKGRQAMMPAAEVNQLQTEADINNVAHYVRSLSGLDHDAAAATEGEKKFNTVCVACHGMDGKGNPMLGAPNLTDKIWLYGGSLETIKETLVHGRQGIMPAQEEFLGEAKVHMLSTYVYSLSSHNLQR